MLTEERKRELDAKLAAIFNRPKPKPKPKVVVSDGVAIRDADVVVSPKDPNAQHSADGVVSVRRFDRVTLDLALAERQLWERQQVEARNRPPGRLFDPMNVWGSNDE
jgi:hypothetical protein